MRKLTILIILTLVALLTAQEPQTVLNLNWGEQGQAVGIRQAPEGLYGPAAFRVIDDKILILDNQNGLLKIFENKQLNEQLPIHSLSDDFLYFSNNNYIILENNQIFRIEKGNRELIYNPPARQIIRSIKTVENQTVGINLADGTNITKNLSDGHMSAAADGHLSQNKRLIETVKKDRRSGKIRILDQDGAIDTVLTLDFPANNLASIQFVALDNRNRLYLNIEKFKNEVPLSIERELRVITLTGRELAAFNLPTRGYARTFRDLYIDPSGSVYQMITTEQGLEILRWTLPEADNPESPLRFHCPDQYYELYKNETVIFDEPAQGNLMQQLPKPTVYPEVTEEEALVTGDSYVQLEWDCAAENLTGGLIIDSYGHYVRTPGWVTVGTHDKVPYKWGGFQTIDQFVSGLANGKYAGDSYTSKTSGTPSAVGVDCSGFVSRCWKLPSHYSTRMMDDDITKPYESWEQTRPGDACHKPGHVRMIVKHNDDGTINMVEAAGYNWRVSYKNYSYSAIVGYTPRYYINMQGRPGNIPQPTLHSFSGDDPVCLDWTVGGKENVYQVNAYTSTDGQSWTLESALATDSSRIAFSLNNNHHLYYRLKSVSASDQTSEGLPSDGYGIYRLDGHPKVLIVDGFDRTSASYGSWPHNYHNFVLTLGQALKAKRIPFESAANESVISSDVILGNYEAVFWILGDESTADETFDSNEQNIVKNYLQNGGRLFVSGSEIAWDLDNKGSSSDKAFFNDILKAEYVEDDAKSYTVNGQHGTPFSGLSLNYDDGGHGVYPEDYPDVIKPVNGSQTAMKYGNGKVAAIYFDGPFQGGAAAKLFYMGFPFETIYDKNGRNALISAVTDFFGLNETAIATDDPALRPDNFRLISNYPNPFNASTTIRFYIPSAGEVRLQLYNVLAERVLELRRRFNTPGQHDIMLSVPDLPSGAYFYKTVFQSTGTLQSQQGKLFLIK